MKMFIQYDDEKVCQAHLAHDDRWSVIGTVLGSVGGDGVFAPGAIGSWVQWPHDSLENLPRIGEVIDPATL